MSGGATRSARTRAPRGRQAVGIEQRAALGAVEEHVGPVVADGAPRLDEEVGPARVVGIGAEPGRGRDVGAGQRQVALRGRRHGPQLVAPDREVQRLAPSRPVGGEVLRCIEPVPELEQATPELAGVERVASVAGDGAQGAADAGQADALADFEWPVGAQLARPRQRVDEVAGQSQHDGGGKAFLGQLDRRCQDLHQGQPSVARVQGEPAVHRAGHRHAADVTPQGHHGPALGPKARRVGTRAGVPDGQERLGRRPRRRHHGQHITPETAQVGPDHRHHRARGDGGVGGRTAARQHGDPRRRRQLVRRRDHAPQRGTRGEGCERECHGPDQRTTTDRSTSPRCMRENASSTSSMPMVSLTKRSRSSRPSR